MQRKESLLSFPIARFMAENPVPKDRPTREKHTHLFNVPVMCHRNLHKDMKSKEMGKPVYFMLGLMGKWVVMTG